ncbi:hypothetical protein ACFPYI_01850 [Halomarina salina]|uniref:Uncharacterized protein n=1 Tax=Halomarina salina TaxID=1872699 RepID=A0ABD5RID4_9EURY|nr:hypothetical protein [Halomarina salina]
MRDISNREASRMLRGLRDRLRRSENEDDPDSDVGYIATPPPDTEGSSDSVTASTANAGSGQWDSADWDLSEWGA